LSRELFKVIGGIAMDALMCEEVDFILDLVRTEDNVKIEELV